MLSPFGPYPSKHPPRGWTRQCPSGRLEDDVTVRHSRSEGGSQTVGGLRIGGIGRPLTTVDGSSPSHAGVKRPVHIIHQASQGATGPWSASGGRLNGECNVRITFSSVQAAQGPRPAACKARGRTPGYWLSPSNRLLRRAYGSLSFQAPRKAVKRSHLNRPARCCQG